MRYQSRPWSCGPAALVNAARALGRRVTEGRVRRLSGSTETVGTDEHGLMVAARELGFSAVPHHSRDAATSWAFVRSNVLDGRPCLLCVDTWGHWVTAVGIVGDRVILIDPANTVKNMAELGVHTMRRSALSRRWRHPREDEPFYAIAIGHK